MAPRGQPSLSRRELLKRTLVLGAAGVATPIVAVKGPAVANGAVPWISETVHRRPARDLVTFTPIPLHSGSQPLVSPDYDYEVMLPWGLALQPGGPAMTVPVTDPLIAEQQIGLAHDGIWYFPIGGASDHGVMCINHEFRLGPTNVRAHQASLGMSVVEIKKTNGKWAPVASSLSRRITGYTPVDLVGPAANHAITTSSLPPAGTATNCAGVVTPWGTYLSNEEGFRILFGADGAFVQTEEQRRYGLVGGSPSWHVSDPRFDLTDPNHVNEVNRWGWVVEIDPMVPSQPPRKLTGLGRFMHEGSACVIGRGLRAVVYMGDDSEGEFIYKFVGDNSYIQDIQAGRSPLEQGRLYVAQFRADGTGRWQALTLDNDAIAARFSSLAEVMVYARLAADLAQATPMGRPEWTAVAPNGRVYCSLTSAGGHGQVIRWQDDDDHIGSTFRWSNYLDANEAWQDPETGFGAPDGLWVDPDGRLFIETDGIQPGGSNNQLLVSDTFTGETRRLFVGPAGCEITGITQTPDQRTLFINVQHPSVVWPNLLGPAVPRDATIALTRKDGGIVGS